MGSLGRSKTKFQLWKKAVVHFLLCFVMGFFTGFTPTGKASIFSSSFVSSNRSGMSPQPAQLLPEAKTRGGNFDRSLMGKSPEAVPTRSSDSKIAKVVVGLEKEEPELIPRRLVIIVTPTSTKDRIRGVLLRRLANTLKLVPPPLLWVVVEAQSNSSEVSETLRKTGVMYRHLVFKKDSNFSDHEVEMDHQRNLALNHIEHHRLSGIVHFARLSNVYDLSLFDEIRSIEAYGTWPMALLSANRKRVSIRGPVCDSSKVIGWHLKEMYNITDKTSTVHSSTFAFNSSILWDPEKWGRTSSVQDTSLNPIKFVRKEILEEETKLKGVPAEGCSKIMIWHLNFQKGTT